MSRSTPVNGQKLISHSASFAKATVAREKSKKVETTKGER
jgi:hypothetical protein